MFADLSIEHKIRKDSIEQNLKSQLYVATFLIDYMSNSLFCGPHFCTFNLITVFNHERLVIEIDLNLPAPWLIQVLERRLPDVAIPTNYGSVMDRISLDSAGGMWRRARHAPWIYQNGNPTQNSYAKCFNKTFWN